MAPNFINYRKILKRDIGRPEAKRILYWLLEQPVLYFNATIGRTGIPEIIFFIYRAYPDMTKTVIEHTLSFNYRLRNVPERLSSSLSPYAVPATCLLTHTKEDRIFDLYKKMYKMLSFDLRNPRFLFALLYIYHESITRTLISPRFFDLMYEAFYFGVMPERIMSYDYLLTDLGFHDRVVGCNVMLQETYDSYIVHKHKLTLFEIIARSRHI